MPGLESDDDEGEEESAPPPLQAAAGDFTQTFTPAASFGGAKHGFVFKSGPRGLGYYRDGASTATVHARSETQLVEATEDLDELD